MDILEYVSNLPSVTDDNMYNSSNNISQIIFNKGLQPKDELDLIKVQEDATAFFLGRY